MSRLFEDTLTLENPGPGEWPVIRGFGKSGTWRPRQPPSPRQRRRWSTEGKLVVAAALAAVTIIAGVLTIVSAMSSYASYASTASTTLDALSNLHDIHAVLGVIEAPLASGAPDRPSEPVVWTPVVRDGLVANVDNLSARFPQPGRRLQLDQLKAVVGGLRTDTPAGRSGIREANRIVAAMIADVESEYAGHVARGERHRELVVSTVVDAAVAVAAIVLGLFGLIFRDLHLRARLGREREAGGRFLESIITAIPHPILIKEAETLTYALVNPAMAELLGQPREDALEKRDRSFFEEHKARRAEDLDRHALDSGAVEAIVAEIPTANRGRRTFRITRLPFQDDARDKGYLLTLAEDITDSLRDQAALKAVNRTLMQQAEELRAANSELSHFSYTVSHDLRTPLRAIDGFAEMLAEDYGPRLDDVARRYITVVRESSQRMGALIDALLYYTRIGRDPLVSAEVDMGKVVTSGRDVAEAGYPAVSIRWDIGELPSVPGDKVLLGEAFTHLLVNAAKFSQSARFPTVQVRAARAGGEVVFSVRDNGVGFDMKFYPKLFGLFQRLHSDCGLSGTGMGLAIVHRIVGHHGGKVWAESSPGAGAVFYVSLPAEVVDV